MARFFNLPETHSNGRIEMLSLPAGVAGFTSRRFANSEDKVNFPGPPP